MVAMYVKLIKAGKITIDDVPAKWQAAVKAALEA